MDEKNNQQNENLEPEVAEESAPEVKSEAKNEVAATATPKKSIMPIIIGAMAAVIVALVVVLVILLGGKDKPSSNNDNPTSDNQTAGEEHTHTPAVAVVENKIPATCTTDGSYDLVVYCTGCGVKITWSSHTEPALGHNYVNAVCTTCGDVDYSEGLEFTSNGDGTCYVRDVGTCSDIIIKIPPVSPDGDRVTGIGKDAFNSHYTFIRIIIPDGVTSIGDGAFFNCGSLKIMTIPDSVTNIGDRAFVNCDALTDVYYKGSEEDWAKISIGNSNSYLTSANITFNYQN